MAAALAHGFAGSFGVTQLVPGTNCVGPARAGTADHPEPTQRNLVTETIIDRRNFYINGQWVAPSEPNDLDVIDPSTEQVCAVISLGGQADTDAAVAAANLPSKRGHQD